MIDKKKNTRSGRFELLSASDSSCGRKSLKSPCTGLSRFLSAGNQNDLHSDKAWCERTLRLWLTAQQFIHSLISCFLWPFLSPSTPGPFKRDPTLCIYIYLCVRASIRCKVKEMNVSPGKILGSSVYSLEAFTAITSPGQVRAILFSPPSLLDTCPSISFFLFLRLYWNS